VKFNPLAGPAWSVFSRVLADPGGPAAFCILVVLWPAGVRDLHPGAGWPCNKGMQMAEISKVDSVSAISKLEQREIDPSWSTIQALASALRVSSQVFEEEPAPRRPESKERKKKP